MAKIKLHSNGLASFTSVPNIFIDKYMTNANGEYIKIYLYLLRCLGREDKSFSIQNMADAFEYTEKDILRALHYWEKQELMHLEFDEKEILVGIQLANPYHPGHMELPTSLPSVPAAESSTGEKDDDKCREKDAYTAEQIEQFLDNESVQEILFITENYLGRTLNATDIRTILYWYDGLKFPADLIEYLIETCISNGHTSLRYMEKVALSWADNGISSVAQARAEHTMYSKEVYSVMNAFGINGRNLISSEVEFVKKWTGEYAFSMDIIKEACRRTITGTGKASFEYADTILTNWHKNHVHTLNDVVKLDTIHKAKNTAKVKELRENSTLGSRFNNFPQRSYNYEQLEQQLLKTTS